MLYRARNSIHRQIFRWSCGGILETQPLAMHEAGITFVSMVSHSDLLMYLTAIKSIHRWIRCSAIVVVNDGSLTAEDRKILHHHLGGPTIISVSDVDIGDCPRGGTWERLLTIVNLVPDSFVIQVDSDLLAIKEIPEVHDAIKANKSFTLGTRLGRERISLSAATELVRGSTSDHVQVRAEKSFPKLEYKDKYYIRGCSGFAGFARGLDLRESLERFSRDLYALIGPKWLEWGSEQVASNFLVANDLDSLVLPYPKYASFHPAVDHGRTHLYHFIGEHRFAKGRYVALSRRVIAELV